MGSSRFLPLVIAGIIGLFVGWLFGPDVDEVQETVVARVDQLDAKITEIGAPIGAVQSAVTSVDERTTAIATQVQAIGNPSEAITVVGGSVDALSQKLDALQAKVDAIAAAPTPAPIVADGGGQADALATQIGNTGAVLLAGQTAIFGDKRLTVASVADGSASIGAEGAAPSDVQAGASIDLGDGCNVSLAGVSGPAAYLAPTGCSTGGEAAAPAAAPAPAPTETAAAPAAPAPAPEAATSEGTPISVGQSALFGEKRVFLSRIVPADNVAFVMLAGGDRARIEVKTDAPADLGEGCMLTLAGIEGTTASFTASGCDGSAAPAEAAAPAAEPATAEAPAPGQAAPASMAPAGGSGGGTAISVGQSALFGEKRVFLSRIVPADNVAFVMLAGGDRSRIEVKADAPADLGDGCMLTLASIEGTTASFTGSGCDGASAPAETAAAPAAASVPAAAPAPAPAEASAPTAPAGAASALAIGQTATFGEKRIFLSRVTPELVSVVVVDTGPMTVAPGASLDLGDGCTATLDSVTGNTASFSGAGC